MKNSNEIRITFELFSPHQVTVRMSYSFQRPIFYAEIQTSVIAKKEFISIGNREEGDEMESSGKRR